MPERGLSSPRPWGCFPRPKLPTPAAATEMDNPTASAGTPLPVVFGTVTVKSANFLGYWAKEIHEYDTD